MSWTGYPYLAQRRIPAIMWPFYSGKLSYKQNHISGSYKLANLEHKHPLSWKLLHQQWSCVGLFAAITCVCECLYFATNYKILLFSCKRLFEGDTANFGLQGELI